MDYAVCFLIKTLHNRLTSQSSLSFSKQLRALIFSLAFNENNEVYTSDVFSHFSHSLFLQTSANYYTEKKNKKEKCRSCSYFPQLNSLPSTPSLRFQRKEVTDRNKKNEEWKKWMQVEKDSKSCTLMKLLTENWERSWEPAIGTLNWY